MPKFYPTANALTTSETSEILATALKKRIYPDANVIVQTEAILTGWGLNWFLSNTLVSEVETSAKCGAVPFMRYFPSVALKTKTETNCESLAIWPEPPAPIATVSCAGKELHKQNLRSENSHQISIAINCEQTTIAAVGLLQIIFELTQPENITVLKKTRFDAPGGIILDIIKDQAEGKILLLADLQLRPNQIKFAGTEAEFDFAVIVENSAINQRADAATGTLILSKD